MVCTRCGFEKWDGFSRHTYGGRESAGVNCFGPDPDKPKRVAVIIGDKSATLAAIAVGIQATSGAAVAEVETAPTIQDVPIMKGTELEAKQAAKKKANPAWSAALEKLETKIKRQRAKGARPAPSTKKKTSRQKTPKKRK